MVRVPSSLLLTLFSFGASLTSTRFVRTHTVTARKTAAKALYELSDVSHKKNRTMIVRSCPSIVNALCTCLLATNGDARHLSLLSLNNLSIPSENKKTFNNEECREVLVAALVRIVETDANEVRGGESCDATKPKSRHCSSRH